MLMALNDSGEEILLVGSHARELAIQRKNQLHFCPQCNGPLIVKAGTIMIPHFAHRKAHNCHSFSEPESERHLTGKRDLFDWISRTASVRLESRLPGSAQRPDLLTGQTAVEFQCSTISAALFSERTAGYHASGYDVFWLYGGAPLVQKGRFFVITSFHQLFFRYHPLLGFYFLQYDPDEKRFTLFSAITQVSASRFLVRRSFFSPVDWPFPPAAPLQHTVSPLSLPLFFQSKREWIHHSRAYNSQKRFFQFVYAAGHNPSLLPPWVGLPVKNGLSIANHPLEWQFYLWKTSLHVSPEARIRQLIDSGILKEKAFPLIPSCTPEAAAAEYMALLAELDAGSEQDAASMGVMLKQEADFIEKHGKHIIGKLIF